MNKQLKNLLATKRRNIEQHQTFIMDLVLFMLNQELKPVHPVYSQNIFMHYYEIGALKLKLFERSVPRKPKFAANRFFSIRVERDHDEPEFPLCWLEVEYLQNHGEESPGLHVQIETAMKNNHHVFVPEGENGWVQHIKKIIDNQKERMVNLEERNEQKQINHLMKILRLSEIPMLPDEKIILCPDCLVANLEVPLQFDEGFIGSQEEPPYPATMGCPECGYDTEEIPAEFHLEPYDPEEEIPDWEVFEGD